MLRPESLGVVAQKLVSLQTSSCPGDSLRFERHFQTPQNPPAMWETWVPSLGWEGPLEKGKAPHSSILAWRIPDCIVYGVTNSWTRLTFTFQTPTPYTSDEREPTSPMSEIFTLKKTLPAFSKTTTSYVLFFQKNLFLFIFKIGYLLSTDSL